jgi:hypothetical protein
MALTAINEESDSRRCHSHILFKIRPTDNFQSLIHISCGDGRLPRFAKESETELATAMLLQQMDTMFGAMKQIEALVGQSMGEASGLYLGRWDDNTSQRTGQLGGPSHVNSTNGTALEQFHLTNLGGQSELHDLQQHQTS